MNYYELLKPYFENFPKEKIYVILHEDIKSDSEKALRDLFTFLEIDNSYIPSNLTEKVNAAQEVKNAKIAQGSRFIARILLMFKLRVLIDKLFGIYCALNKRDISYPKMNSETRSFLLKGFLPDISRLESLIERDLSAWKI
jgi:hypothetical protein